MDLSRLGVFCFLDPLPASALGAFARRVEQLGYGTLWFAEGMGRESFSLARGRGHSRVHPPLASPRRSGA